MAEAVLRLLMESDVEGLIGTERCECNGRRQLRMWFGWGPEKSPRLVRCKLRR